ncbi:MAG TPA: orotidine-5'-phosphate decarboxylase [Gammaproteobacteria bacterium]|nr:orotidine-5'-phosphate decarboxylase [Gammaproteobacteria bacterium]HAN61595.1 orotidine-5'-phosphate decarboxylase [Gammaproteobacteria bacterium]HAU10982.1 orotidine-5'-phosphate decarboxylase [Gammaproteobacteria bacterium]HIA88008.1 orotidine-5'-phosphate decarboxylase [Gammaproteobacteria bacterium]HIC24363.1 orotidine-5'-phosphate decarboxylase [Gammaproteobacteria bacterium]
MKAIVDNQRLIVALDLPSTDDARRLVAQLDNSVNFYKVGLELFMAGGYFEFVDELAAAGKQVFVDLKFFDVPATVGRAVERLQHRNISFVTVHGNDGIMQAAAASKGDLKILAVTVLTSLDRGDLDDLGFQCDVEELVLSRARRAIHCGCDGVVASGHEAARLRDELGDRLMIVIPGIRPVENTDDQKRTVTVQDAFSHGADYIVVGRPIRDADNPRKVAETIQREIASALMSARPS